MDRNRIYDSLGCHSDSIIHALTGLPMGVNHPRTYTFGAHLRQPITTKATRGYNSSNLKVVRLSNF